MEKDREGIDWGPWRKRQGESLQGCEVESSRIEGGLPEPTASGTSGTQEPTRDEGMT